jgi:tetratricopeptide (TPR) repeat protein
MSIETPTAVAGVRGTELDLQLAADETATLTVAEGEVQFTNAGVSVLVRESQQSIARPGQAPTAPLAANVPFIIEWTNDVQPVVLLLETAFVSQDPARLSAALKELERERDESAERRRRLGDVRHDRGEPREALTDYDAARERLGPAAPAAQRAQIEGRIGQTLLELGKLPEAEAAFRTSLALDPSGGASDEAPEALPRSLAPTLPRAGSARAGLVMTLLSRRKNADALAEARAAVTRNERSPLAHTVMALAQIRAEDRAGARRSLESALALDPDDAQALAWQSFLLRAEGRLEEADASARRAVARAPHSSLARQSLSDTLLALGRDREAREEAARAVAMNPLSPGARVSLGRALLQQGDVEHAAWEANRAVALDPDLERARFFYGVMLAEQRRLERAAAELRRAVALDPSYLEARAFLARVYLEQGRRSEAVALAREATAADPGFAPARAALGRVYWRAGRLEAAEAEYRRALELRPGSTLYHLELARVNLDRNNLPDALANGLAAADRAPTSSEAHAMLGLIYDRMENREQALRAYRDALSFSSENALARIGVGLDNADLDTGVVDIAQALLRDPSVPSLRFKPGVTTELTPGIGSNETFRLDGFHRDQFWGGKLHDLSFFNQLWDDNYRNDRQERRTFAMTNLAAAPGYRTQVLAQALYDGSKRALPGALFDPDPNDSASSRTNWWDLATRYQVDPATHVWFHATHHLFHRDERNPDAPRDGSLRALSLTDFGTLGLEGRLDHRWGRGHTSSYVLFAGRAQTDTFNRTYDPLEADFRERGFSGRDQEVLQTLQDDFRPNSRLSLIAGITVRRSTSRFGSSGEAATHWLPFGQLTYALGRRDLVRLIAHERRSLLLNSALQPTEAFVVGEAPPVVFTGLKTYELDYEHRFSARSFGKLFLFRSDVQDLLVSPEVDQAPGSPDEAVDIRVPAARTAGLGARYERQITHFLSGYLRYTYAPSTDRTAGPTQGWLLPMRPRSRAVLGLNYIDRAGTKVFLEASWQSRMFIDPIWSDRPTFARLGNREGFDPNAPRPTFPSRLLLNLRFGREPSVRREWVFHISNLLNTGTLYWSGFPAPGRTYLLQYFFRF